MILPCKHAPDAPPHDRPSSSQPIPSSADGDVVVTSYEPRRSDRVGEAVYDLAQADGDTWVERIAVCEGGVAPPTTSPSDHGGGTATTTVSSNQLVLRSYFRNQRTRQRAWDEPPSGASNITFATADDRRDAELRRKELQDALDAVPPDLDRGTESSSATGPSGAKPTPRGGLLGRFRKNKASTSPTFRQLDESQDLNLQKAIARSMADQGGRRAGGGGGGSGGDSPPLWFDPDSQPTTAATQGAYQPFEDDEDVALAKALSLSESAPPSRATSTVPSNNASSSDEDAVLQRVLEESRRDAERAAKSMSDEGVAVLPTQSSPWEDFELLLPDDGKNDNRQGSPPSSFREDRPPDLVNDDNMYEDDERWNRKMPAKPSVDLFDPFAFSSPPPSFSPANMVMDDSSVTATPDGPTSRKVLVAPAKPGPATKAATGGRGRLFGRMTGGNGSGGGGGRPKSGSLENDAGLV